MSRTVWISQKSWDKIWSALHNIHVRYSHTVCTPSAKLSGAGNSARIHIDLPAGKARVEKRTGPFLLEYDPQKNKIQIGSGWMNVNGFFFKVPAASIDPPEIGEDESRILCLHADMDADGNIAKPEYLYTEPGVEDYPVGAVTCTSAGEEKKYDVETFCVSVAVFILAKECVFTTGDK